MTTSPLSPVVDPRQCRLARFADFHAGRIVSWVRSDAEAHWLAPRTPPPLTIDKVQDWVSAAAHAWMMVAPSQTAPLGYGEVNVLNRRRNEYWLGHLIVDPALRGFGLGRRLTTLLLDHAFDALRANCVKLVVFPENNDAVRCYMSAGMHVDGFEHHTFNSPRSRERLVRMVITRAKHQRSVPQ